MAKHKNHSGKKVRCVPSSMSLRKHRMSGKSKAPKIVKVLACRDNNRREEADQERKKNRAGELYDSVAELMEKGQ